MNDAPKGWPRISASVFYDDAGAAIDWLCKAFGFAVQLKIEGAGGRIEHSQLTYGDGLVMIGEAGGNARGETPWRTSPRAVGGKNTQALFLYVDAVDAHCDRARAAGAKITMEPVTTDYGEGYWTDRSYQAEDPEGHRWSFAQRMK